jgi:hypothetical protein
VNILDKILNHKKTEIEKIPEIHLESSNFKRLSLKKALKRDIDIFTNVHFDINEFFSFKVNNKFYLLKDIELNVFRWLVIVLVEKIDEVLKGNTK